MILRETYQVAVEDAQSWMFGPAEVVIGALSAGVGTYLLVRLSHRAEAGERQDIKNEQEG